MLAGGVGEHAADQSRHDTSNILGVISLASPEFGVSLLIKLGAYILTLTQAREIHLNQTAGVIPP